MVTYDELFTFVTMLCAVVTLVVTLTQHKKQRPRPGKIRRYFQQITLPAAGHHPAFGSLVKYIIAKYAEMSNRKNAPVLPTPGRPIHPEMHTYYISNNIVSSPEQPCKRNKSSLAVIFVPQNQYDREEVIK